MNEKDMQTSEGIIEADKEIKNNVSNITSPNTNSCEANCDIQALYSGEEAKGFDLSNGSEWIYPTNYPVRSYQKNIVSNALFKNTLVCLPTGLGKTFIAAVVMYNYHRWYPKNLIVFMAHSKPLVTQQVNACSDIMGISQSDIAELNGHMVHSNRKKQWESKKIFFLTPQVFNNDLARGNVKAESIRCIVIDEAHKALGNQAYCQVIRSIKPFNSNFRVLALSATPGDDMNMVKEVIQNLMISHLELRTENDPDIKPYIHGKKIETIIVKLDNIIMEVKERFLRAVDKYIKPLVQNKILPQSFSSLNPFSLVLKQRQFIQNPSVRDDLRGIMLSNFSVAISLFYALEELTIHGLRSFLTKLKSVQSKNNSASKVNCRIANDEELRSLVEYIENYLGPDNNVSFDPNSSLTRLFDDIDNISTESEVVYSHPKFAVLENIVQNHFREQKESTRIIIFCKSRQCTGEICKFLARFRPVVKPMIFIGQSQTTCGIVSKGFNQAAQQIVMKRFRDGIYNTLIATCVAEEGLDIGEVDLIVNFDSGKSSNTQIQRNGRTGRKRDGRVVNLVTEGKEHQNYNISVSKGKKMNKKLVDDGKNLPFYTGNPRLIPRGLNPICQEIYFNIKKDNNEDLNRAHKNTKRANKKKLHESSNIRNPKRIKKMNKVNNIENNHMNSESFCISPKKCDTYSFVERECAILSDELCKKNELNVEKYSEINHENHLNKKHEIKDVKDNSRNSTLQKYMKIDELNKYEKPVTVLIKNNIDLKENYSWEYVPHEELENETKNLLVQFLQSNQSPLNSKNTFSIILNKNFSEVLNKKNSDLIKNLEKRESFKLSESALNYLANQDLDIQNITICLNESWNMLFKKTNIKSNNIKEINSAKEETKVLDNLNEETKIVDDIEMEDFFYSIQANVKSAYPGFISSTPLRKTERYNDNEKENIIDELPCALKDSKTVENFKSNISESNFQLWDESDFFNIQENSLQNGASPALVQGSSTKKRKSTSFKDSSLISITQALDFVTNANSKFFNPPIKPNNEKANTSFSPTSPVLFYSQKRKVTQGKSILTSGSPVLSQQFKGKKGSRKRLIYKSINDEPILSNSTSVAENLETTINQTGHSDDLFIDAEIALQNHKQKSQFILKDAKEMPNKKNEKLFSENIVKNQKNSDDNTLDYDLEERNTDNIKISCNAKNDGSLILDEKKEKNIFEMDEKKIILSSESCNKIEMNCNQNIYNNVKNVNVPSVEVGLLSIPNPIKSGPKMAIVRPLGFENMALSQNGTLDCNGKGINKIDSVTHGIKSEENKSQSYFTCNFSLFDDFGKNCLDVPQTENVNKEEKGKGKLIVVPSGRNNSKKVNCLRSSVIHFESDDDGASNDSDIFMSKECPRKINENKRVYDDNSENSVQKDIENFKCMSDSGDLSDGAIEAIKAIEEYEYNQKPSNKVIVNGSETRKKPVLELDSDDSEEFFLPARKQEKPTVKGNTFSYNSRADTMRSNKDKNEIKEPVNEFIEMEAKLSDQDQFSSDEENTSGLDEYDSSFVDERENFTQAPNVDMMAKYLQTVKSPVRAGAFKIPELKGRDDMNVFSQIEVENESDYELDSFCVKEEEKSFEANNEMSELELAEILLDKKEKRKRKITESKLCNTKKKRKFKRVLRIESESSDDEGETSNGMQNLKIAATDCSDIQELFALPFEEENKLEFQANSGDVKKKDKTESVVFVASRQIASAPEITTSLRAKWNINVQVRSAPEADYIVSWRTGINRIYLSDFANGSPAAKTSLKENVLKLMLNFHQPTLIVEDDKNKGLPRTVGCHKTLWASHTYKMLAKLLQNNVRLLFSRSKDDTARIIVLLSKEEKNKGHAINFQVQSDIDSKIEFFSTLPGVNVANAVRISHKFSSIGSFMKNCNSVNHLIREIGVNKETAVKIYRLLFTIPVS